MAGIYEIEISTDVQRSKSSKPEKTFRPAEHHGEKICPRHLEKTFKTAVNEGKALRIQFEELIQL